MSNEDELTGLFARLSPSSRVALGAAEGMRRAMGLDAIHMEHLLAGLHATSDAVRSAIEAAGLGDAEFYEFLRGHSGGRVLAAGDYSIAVLARVPAVSSHAATALTRAEQVADRDGSTVIRQRHLFAAAMTVVDCNVVAALRASGVSDELPDLGRERDTASPGGSDAETAASESHADAVDALEYPGPEMAGLGVNPEATAGPEPVVGGTPCQQCGRVNPPDRRFCGTCGMVLGRATTAAPSPAEPTAGGPASAAPSPVGPTAAAAPSPGAPAAAAPSPVEPSAPPGLRSPAGLVTRGLARVAGIVIGILGGNSARLPDGLASSPAEVRVERHTSATFPSEVASGDMARLAFSIGELLEGGAPGTVSFDAPAGVTSVELVATVHAPAFDVVSPAPQTDGSAPLIALPLNVIDPTWSVGGEFVLHAKAVEQPADAMILLDFWYLSSPVGQIRIETRVVPKILEYDSAPTAPTAHARPSVGDFRISATAPPSADITLFITDEGAGRYLIQATTPNVFMRDLGAFPAGQNAWSYSASMLERFRDAGALSDAARVDRVVGLGLDLWGNLPSTFHDFYWSELYGQDRSIAIYSQEPFIPWELIRPPAGDGRTPGFLGSDFRMARWRNGRLFPDPLVVHDFAVIAPLYADHPLEETAIEAQDLATRFGARLVDGTYDPVAASLRSTEVQLLHFAGHGTFDQNAPLQSRIVLSDQGLLPTDIRRFREGLPRGPFVFLNACEVGEQGWAFTGIGGWAEIFCDVGSVGFVGPYWAVEDVVAHHAALRFYDGLARGDTVGEAIRNVRRAFDEPGPFRHDPTWLAYSLHCQPNIRIDLPN